METTIGQYSEPLEQDPSHMAELKPGVPCAGGEQEGKVAGSGGRSRGASGNERGVDLRAQIGRRAPPTSLPIVLGSSSGCRRLLMELLGWQFSTASPDIDEKAIRDPDPVRMSVMIAHAKADALEGEVPRPGILITADQVCIFDDGNGGVVREKPVSTQQAREFLESYSRRSVTTVTALCVVNTGTGVRVDGCHKSTVFWRDIPPAVVEAVVAGGRTMGSAGGFALEEPSLRDLVERIDGSVDSVYGLPVDLMCELVQKAEAARGGGEEQSGLSCG